MVVKLEQTDGHGPFTYDGQEYIGEGGSLIDVFVDLQPHDACPGGKGTLVVPLIMQNGMTEVGYMCAKCDRVVYQPAQGIC